MASGGPQQYCVEVLTQTGPISRVCDWGTRTCECLHWQDEQFPCPDAFAVGREKGLSSLDVVQYGASAEYFVTDFLDTISWNLVLPPTDPVLKLRASARQEALDDDNGIATYLTSAKDNQAMWVDVKPPIARKRCRVHGNTKFGRYKKGRPLANNKHRGRGSRGANTRNRTRLAASVASVELGKASAHLLCAKCKKAGRIGPQYLGHRGMCPWEDDVSLP